MADYIERMENELAELNDRIGKLSDFIDNNPIYRGLEYVDRSLMGCQLYGMEAYSVALETRVRRARKEAA